MARNDAMTDTGRVSPVITVERQELRKVKTTSTVRSAPRSRVVLTSSTESRIHWELSRTMVSSTPSGRILRKSLAVALARSAICTVFPPVILRRSMAIAGDPLYMAADRASSASSMVVATSPRRIGTPSRVSTTSLSKSAGCSRRPATRTSCSRGPSSSRPAGTSMFSVPRTPITWSTVTARADSRAGSSSTAMVRFSPPTMTTWPTPSTPSNALRSVSSASVVSSRRLRVLEVRQSDTMGVSAMLKRRTLGFSMSAGSCSRISSILERTSCWAWTSLTFSSNSMKIEESPSKELEVRLRTPWSGFTASSILRVTSRSTVSGEAPG